MTGDRLYIAVKAPRPGFVKTRLGKRLGDEAATALYRAFLRDLARLATGVSVPCSWFVTPDDSGPEIEAVAGEIGTRALGQGEGDWTVRQDRLFRTAAQRGEGRVVLVASDSPQITTRLIEEAFSRLDDSDIVFGPVLDGGYWLLGMRTYRDLLVGVEMSTADVLDRLLAKADRAGITVSLLEPEFDVDEVEDLVLLARAAESGAELAASRVALFALVGDHHRTAEEPA